VTRPVAPTNPTSQAEWLAYFAHMHALAAIFAAFPESEILS
jgi:hypothetical protein